MTRKLSLSFALVALGGLVTTAAYYRFAGTTVNVLDFNGVPRTADFTWSGRITDICAALS